MPRHFFFQLCVNFVTLCLISLISNSASAQGFLPPVTYPITGTPSGILVADLNHDTYCDVVIPNETGQSITILLANPDGTLQAPQDYPLGAVPRLAAVADFDLDGHPDIAVACSSGIIVLGGTGGGTFTVLSITNSVSNLYPITAGDFNNDGLPDIATAHAALNGQMHILLGDGGGAFQSPISYPTFLSETSIRDLVCAHMDSDNNLDILACYRRAPAGGGNNEVRLYNGNGDGTFQTSPSSSRAVLQSGIPSNIITGNFGGGQTTETLAISLSLDLVSIDFAQTPPGRTFSVYGGDRGYDLCSADFDGDAAADLAVTNLTDVIIKMNDPLNPGTFQDTAFTTNGTPSIQFLDSGDVNGDGNPDLVSVSLSDGTVSVLLNDYPTNTRVAGWDLY